MLWIQERTEFRCCFHVCAARGKRNRESNNTTMPGTARILRIRVPVDAERNTQPLAFINVALRFGIGVIAPSKDIPGSLSRVPTLYAGY